MNTSQIVTNSDRCHASVNGSPFRTFLYSDYNELKEDNRKSHAIADAKVECFNILAKLQSNGEKATINTIIKPK